MKGFQHINGVDDGVKVAGDVIELASS